MSKVSIRDLRNHGGEVIDRVLRGESVTIVKSGTPVAELVPIAARPLPAHVLVERWKQLPAVDPDALRADLDSLIDPRL
ncbi:MAG: type II toxin-antitoxin system prevent-host-death family antitoxin [Actinomycetota bacterium]|jgi:prevent-host-death family protein|nr:type II toxin-antitoxin system prevent-host-death family antitoxin [Actinomycetota bacterium]